MNAKMGESVKKRFFFDNNEKHIGACLINRIWYEIIE